MRVDVDARAAFIPAQHQHAATGEDDVKTSKIEVDNTAPPPTRAPDSPPDTAPLWIGRYWVRTKLCLLRYEDSCVEVKRVSFVLDILAELPLTEVAQSGCCVGGDSRSSLQQQEMRQMTN